MSIRIIRTGDDPVLRMRALPVPEVNKAIRKLLDDMRDTMYDADGLGLAAPQIGISKRVIVMDVEDQLIELINPEIISRGGGKAVSNEGCLSLPSVRGDVVRDREVKVQGMNRHGELVVIEGRDLLARCIQHEVDHLDGVMFTDYLKPNQIQYVVEEPRRK